MYHRVTAHLLLGGLAAAGAALVAASPASAAPATPASSTAPATSTAPAPSTSSASTSAPACPTPRVTVSPSARVTAGTTVTLHGTGFDCGKSGGHVYPELYPTLTGQVGNGHIAYLTNGDFTYDAQLSTGGTYDLRVDGPGAERHFFPHILTVLAAPQSNPSTSTPKYFGGSVPTAVPAGHVDVATRADQSDESLAGLLAGAGVVLVAGGTVVGVRRRNRMNQAV